MQTTPNLNLALPEPHESADIAPLTANFQKIDDFTSRRDNPHGVTAEQVGAVTQAYVDEQIRNIPRPNVSGDINKHDTSPTAHSDIRTAINGHSNSHANPHEVTAAQVGAVPSNQKGQANGVASLGGDGKVPEEQLDMDKIAKAVLPLFPKWEGGTF